MPKDSLKYLMDIYQQEKDWQQAIRTAERLQKETGINLSIVIAHHYCELAEEELQKGQLEEANRYIKRALVSNDKLVRASLIKGKMEAKAGRYKAAIRALKKVRYQDPDYLIETVQPLLTYGKLDHSEEDVFDHLNRCLHEFESISVALALTDYIQSHKGEEAARNFLAKHLKQRPNIHGLNQLISLNLTSLDAKQRENLSLLKEMTEQLLVDKPNYRCQHCGFSVKQLVWLCPSCKHWNSVKPIHGLEGVD